MGGYIQIVSEGLSGRPEFGVLVVRRVLHHPI